MLPSTGELFYLEQQRRAWHAQQHAVYLAQAHAIARTVAQETVANAARNSSLSGQGETLHYTQEAYVFKSFRVPTGPYERLPVVTINKDFGSALSGRARKFVGGCHATSS